MLPSEQAMSFQWAVIGGGPAGIAAVGKLLDNGYAKTDILWIDPTFTVGDLGALWKNVSSNTTVKRFLDFLNAAQAFCYHAAPDDFELNHLPPEQTCILRQVVAPLQWVSDHLHTQVTSLHASVRELNLSHQTWAITTDGATLYAKHVILATGSTPITRNTLNIPTLALATALDKTVLAEHLDRTQTYGVFGSSHSAIIVVRHLVELGVKKIINFYRSPCRYAVNMGDWILFDNTGLKGDTALWAKTHLNGTLPANLERYESTDEHLAQHLPRCDQMVYALGFQARQTLLVNSNPPPPHNPHNGIIAPGLFGLGIAYPEQTIDPLGHVESSVGLWKFMTYLDRILPLWQNYNP